MQTQQMALIHETITEAAEEVIKAAGGFKKVGPMFFGDISPDLAAGRLRDKINRDRRETLGPDQLMTLIKLGRQIGCKALINFITHEAGYADAQPIDPEDEVARLQREFIESTKALTALASKIELLNTTTLRRVS